MDPVAIPDLTRVAVVIPCYNEAPTIAAVVSDFKDALPGAVVYVIDNNSRDGSGSLAAAAGAVVIPERRQGKGFVIDAILSKVEADFLLMVDGDGTYPASSALDLLLPVFEERADMVVGERMSHHASQAFSSLHYLGNKLVCGSINLIFGVHLQDVMSGYRAFNRLIARTLPVLAFGFDVETEMTLQSLQRRYRILELPVHYSNRPAGSHSKLHTFKDGALVLFKIFETLVAYKPLTFFGSGGLLLGLVGVSLAVLILLTELSIPANLSQMLILLSAGAIIGGFFLVVVGLILHSFAVRSKELLSVITRNLVR
jgi:glycosyltransferase involved in cell wall biosynthesis